MQDSHASTDEYLTDDEVSALTKIPKGTLESWCARRQGPPWIHLAPPTPRYRRADLEAWIASRMVKP